jgi:hypothetical protein
MVHGARRESLGRWNEISYRGIFGSISNSRKRNSKAREKLRCAESAIPRPDSHRRARRVAAESHFRRHTSGRRSNVMPRLYHCPGVGSYIWISLERLQPVGATSAPPSCTGAQLPTWLNLIRTCANNQCAPPSTRQPFCLCVQRTRMPSRRHLRPAGGRFFSVSRDDRESTRESPRDRSE